MPCHLRQAQLSRPLQTRSARRHSSTFYLIRPNETLPTSPRHPVFVGRFRSGDQASRMQ
ncbi:hypothetical protein C725_0870 [Pacificimonas flava]|uniref:Uncharacterized protein n=1 Tax=Pacificimonas flava TaxID=1234595 RepID=M2U7C6_9SPHN|nr:hypothetical protein C725_0870 [Pacificimonas flava]